jgi:uncharacterized membrane protein YwzB
VKLAKLIIDVNKLDDRYTAYINSKAAADEIIEAIQCDTDVLTIVNIVQIGERTEFARSFVIHHNLPSDMRIDKLILWQEICESEGVPLVSHIEQVTNMCWSLYFIMYDDIINNAYVPNNKWILIEAPENDLVMIKLQISGLLNTYDVKHVFC